MEHPLFTVMVNPATCAGSGVRVRINPDNSDIVTLSIAGMDIIASRGNWGIVFAEFARTYSAALVAEKAKIEAAAEKLSTNTFRIDFNDRDRTAGLSLVTE